MTDKRILFVSLYSFHGPLSGRHPMQFELKDNGEWVSTEEIEIPVTRSGSIWDFRLDTDPTGTGKYSMNADFNYISTRRVEKDDVASVYSITIQKPTKD